MHPSITSSKRLAAGAIVLGLGAGLAIPSLVASGCSGDPPAGLGATMPGTGSGAGGGGGGQVENPNEALALWKELEPDLVAACAVCHEAGGIADTPFIAAPDRYASITSWPGIITKDPAESILLTYPRKGGGHSGTNIDSDELADLDLVARVTAWLTAEAALIEEEAPAPGPQIDPLAPIMGFNAVYLDALGPEFVGMAVTFTANELTPSALELRELQVHPTAKAGLHVVHPLFFVYDDGEVDPDPVDSFSNVDQTFEANTAGVLGPGTVVLTNWASGAKIGLAFEVIEIVSPDAPDGGVDGGTTGGCKALDEFVENAQPRFSQSCASCHAGQNPQASAAVDMSDLTSDPAGACAQIKNRINPDSPASSQIFLNTDPAGNAAHPFKFGGQVAQFEDFKAQVSIWILAEK